MEYAKKCPLLKELDKLGRVGVVCQSPGVTLFVQNVGEVDLAMYPCREGIEVLYELWLRVSEQGHSHHHVLG
jgi:hypothetical protein